MRQKVKEHESKNQDLSDSDSDDYNESNNTYNNYTREFEHGTGSKGNYWSYFNVCRISR